VKNGKKEPISRTDLLKENSNDETCDRCGGELAKLETFMGEPFQEGKNFFYWLYWKVLCDICGEMKVKSSKCRTMDFPIVGRYNDRTGLGGR